MARLATVNPSGRVDLVPITFALAGTDTVVTAVDHKPKRTRRLQRLANIAARPAVTLLADHYDDEDWSTLWWVRAQGEATVAEEGAGFERAIDALAARYRQYRIERPRGPAILVTVTRWSGWQATLLG